MLYLFNTSSIYQKKQNQKQFICLADRAAFVSLFSPFFTKEQLRHAPFTGGMKFATQISPLLNSFFKKRLAKFQVHTVNKYEVGNNLIKLNKDG